ncbi:DUF2529 family protein [Staphylococcus massiliensis]|uniref:DUF2529 domain-containing protein n=1 Tax=Staphylococcus massiliensis S46 TaxID=1229783 RepID=K9AX83_9STAP|nr:DUF2529 family protein [Staphylococcus massiliensis]EKU47182.1 hypothetical protein C273_08077 [Staphylococcus massiliensis S46]MCG3400188.1 DUF2529 domain-containing protein [Staphylococcus massiliensis]MCG3402755.1 DUF2529 domain-containing protein [Staphylococcus massiliensis]MCG3413253.1 DUF2529 domain-containing protein [Staphylococcus massiliensis]PNZ99832.1 DUF2529 domain-containing protein [Staphylococcus massiliensis CCUG 55927]
MSKILNTQINGVFNRIENQDLDIQMASQCLIQAIGGEGHVYVKGYDDLKCFESYVTSSSEKLESSKLLSSLNSLDELDTTDRVFLFSPFYTEDMQADVKALIDKDVDFVVVCNKPKETTMPDHLMHFIDLSTPRPIVFTEDYDKVVTPHPIAFSYIYYEIYTQMVEMIRDLDL